MTGTFFGIAIIAATARVYIRIFHIKHIHADDYLFFVAILTLIAGAGLFYVFIEEFFLMRAISEGRTLPASDFMQKVSDASTCNLVAKLLCWTTIFSVKMSFLLYFRALVDRLHRVELWWWFNIVVFVPVAALSISGPLITCPPVGSLVFCKVPIIMLVGLLADVQTVHCSSSPGFLRRERGFVYFSVTSDIVTDIMCKGSITASDTF